MAELLVADIRSTKEADCLWSKESEDTKSFNYAHCNIIQTKDRDNKGQLLCTMEDAKLFLKTHLCHIVNRNLKWLIEPQELRNKIHKLYPDNL